MTFQDKDRDLQKKILRELLLRRTININKDVGVAHMQPEMEDLKNPSVIITGDEIKKFTGREKLRTPVLTDYESALTAPGVEVKRLDKTTLQVSLVPIQSDKNKFKSLVQLEKENDIQVNEDPELGILDF